jgi:branched-chain amino acid transport system substrate-binding protein
MRPRIGLVGVFATLAAALAVTNVAPAASGRASEQPGVTSTTIVLGATAPLSGQSAAYAAMARGAETYFKHVNAKGGVYGRKLVYRLVDDGSSVPQAVVATRQLVEQENVFAVFNSFGTDQGIAVRDYLNQRGVPQLFVASGAAAFGYDYASYPYSSGLRPSFEAEGWVYGKYVARTRPGSRVAVLFQDDDSGRELLGGLKGGLQRAKAKVVAAQPYPPTASEVGALVAKLKASKADTFAIFAPQRITVQAYVTATKLGWKPKLVIANAAAASASVMRTATDAGAGKLVNRTLSIAYLKDPTDPRWRSDAAMKLYFRLMRQLGPSVSANDVNHVYGMAAAWTMVEALKKAGKSPTRRTLLDAVDTMNVTGNPFLLPGIAVHTDGARDHFPIEQMLLQRWQKSSWRSFGGLWVYRP